MYPNHTDAREGGKPARCIPWEPRVRDGRRELCLRTSRTRRRRSRTAREGLNEIVTVKTALKYPDGRASGLSGQIDIPIPLGIYRGAKGVCGSAGPLPREVCLLATIFAPSLSDYGYREGRSGGGRDYAVLVRQQPLGEAASRPSFRPAAPRPRIRAAFHDLCGSRSRGAGVVRGLRSFAMGFAAHRTPGPGQCLLRPSLVPPGLALAVSPLWRPRRAVPLPVP